MEDKIQWYVVHTYSGHELKVKANLEKRIESIGMGERIKEILVPTEEKIKKTRGKKKVVDKKIFPGYILVRMLMDDKTWYVVRNTPGVTGFVSSGTKPLPLQKEEIDHILSGMGLNKQEITLDFEVGDSVMVTDGPFEEFIGIVQEIHLQQQKVKVMVSMFGRETPVELDFDQVEPE
ncbi:MAG: transcription termination/antitermination protein NusG [Halanaerobiales bacterium]|nr:transcription termination/antitermination protein NusG [Halanaerobiales bacterium]